VLKIETAGEQSNFNFTFCPSSGHVAKIILDAREKMLGQADDGEGPVNVEPSKRISKSRVKRTATKSAGSRPARKVNVRGIGAEVIEHSRKVRKK